MTRRCPRWAIVVACVLLTTVDVALMIRDLCSVESWKGWKV
jgi:hypothetical protein